MATFMKNWGINHVFSVPHFPSSNGLAESAVKAVKNLLAYSTANGDIESETFLQGLLEFRNTPRNNGQSPAEMIFGHHLRSIVPAHTSTFDKKWQDVANNSDKVATEPPVITGGRNLVPIKVGQDVWVQDPSTKRWSTTGTVVQARGRNYTLKMPSGRLLWRNRHHIRVRVIPVDTSTNHNVLPSSAMPKSILKKITFADEPDLRQSTRRHCAPTRFSPD